MLELFCHISGDGSSVRVRLCDAMVKGDQDDNRDRMYVSSSRKVIVERITTKFYNTD